MRKLLVSLVVALACATAFTPLAFAQGRSSTGDPGPGDNCTAYYQEADQGVFPFNGRAWHACALD